MFDGRFVALEAVLRANRLDNVKHFLVAFWRTPLGSTSCPLGAPRRQKSFTFPGLGVGNLAQQPMQLHNLRDEFAWVWGE